MDFRDLFTFPPKACPDGPHRQEPEGPHEDIAQCWKCGMPMWVPRVPAAESFELLADMPVAVGPHGVQVRGLLRTHGPDACKDDPNCCIHKPSDHPLNKAPMNWRADRGLMERVCAHGVGHPDPDDLAHKRRMIDDLAYRKGEIDAYAVHGCDGCC